MVHPEYRRLTGAAMPLEETLTPIYPLTEGVPQGRLRALIQQALGELERSALRDWLPGASALPPGLPSLKEALVYRSEEHTSELQSRFDLVCRLLLEKKKNKNSTHM